MREYQREFIELALRLEVLRFGSFTLKSGRQSPYFFNAGLFSSGGAASALGRCYAAAIQRAGIEFDMLFGPAYKGIPLVAVTAAALADHEGVDKPFAFNRKEAKTHGEGGNIIGADLHGRVLIVDDVMTAGTAIREACAIIEAAGAEPAGVAISLDRQERGTGAASAVQQVRRDYGVPVVSIVTLDDLVEHLRVAGGDSGSGALEKIVAYRREYGVSED